MPTLFRFLVVCAVIAGSIYGAMWALATFVEPKKRDVTIRLPSERVKSMLHVEFFPPPEGCP